MIVEEVNYFPLFCWIAVYKHWSNIRKPHNDIEGESLYLTHRHTLKLDNMVKKYERT